MKYSLMLLLIFMSLVMSPGELRADCALAVEQRSGVPVRVLENRYLRVEAAPAACGAIVGLHYLPLGADLVPPFEYKVEKIDLLPDQVQVGGGGGRSFFWGYKCQPAQKMTLEQEEGNPDRVAVELLNPYYQGIECTLRRRLSLERDCSKLKIGITLKNIGEVPLSLRLWDNLVAYLNPSGKDDVLIPGRGDVSRVGTVGVQKLKHDGIFVKGRKNFAKDVRVAATRNWIARRNDGSPLILAVRLVSEPLSPDGFFYSWSSDGDSPIRTMEIICPPVKLLPGGEQMYELEYMIFQGLDNLKEICGDIGMNCESRQNRLEWQFAVVRPTPAQTLKINAGDRILGELKLPAMRPGQAYRATLPLDRLPEGEVISGEFGDGACFRLLEPVSGN